MGWAERPLALSGTEIAVQRTVRIEILQTVQSAIQLQVLLYLFCGSSVHHGCTASCMHRNTVLSEHASGLYGDTYVQPYWQLYKI